MTERWAADGLVDLVTVTLLHAIARTGSVTAAAGELGVSQQAASARLARLERLLGHRLMDRSISGSALTEHGAMVLEWTAPVLDAARRAALSLDALRHFDAPLTVAASQTVAELLLPGWLQIFRGREPEAVVRLVSGNSEDVVRQVRAGEAQLGFIESPTPPGGLASTAIAEDELVVVVAPDHPWAAGDAITAAELGSVPLLLREAGSGTRATLESWLRAHGAEPAPPAAELGTTSAIRAAAVAGVAPAVLSGRAVRAELAAGQLVRVALQEAPPRRRLAAVWAPPGPGALATTLAGIARSAERDGAARDG